MSQWCEVGACLLLGWFLGLVLGLVLGLEWGGLKPPPRSKHTLPRLPLWNKVVVVVPRSGAVVVGAPGGGRFRAVLPGGFGGVLRGGLRLLALVSIFGDGKPPKFRFGFKFEKPTAATSRTTPRCPSRRRRR
jgi:hypothetical protein